MIYQLLNILLTKIKNSMLRSDLCDYSDGYIVVKVTKTAEGDSNLKKEIKS